MIEAEKLSFGYKSNGKEILKNISFRIKRGKLVSIIGANGAGKSTLLKVIVGILHGTGSISIDNTPIQNYNKKEFYNKVSYLAQNNDCNARLTVVEVILLGRMSTLSFRISDEDINAVENIIKLLSIEHLSSCYIDELSGGQQQLVFIAQALVRQSEIIVLDEPISALDLSHQFEIMSILKKFTISHDVTTLVTLHHLDIAAKFSDEILVLNDGQIYGQGCPKDIFTKEMIKDVYHISAEIYLDKFKCPHVIPFEAIK